MSQKSAGRAVTTGVVIIASLTIGLTVGFLLPVHGPVSVATDFDVVSPPSLPVSIHPPSGLTVVEARPPSHGLPLRLHAPPARPATSPVAVVQELPKIRRKLRWDQIFREEKFERPPPPAPAPILKIEGEGYRVYLKDGSHIAALAPPRRHSGDFVFKTYSGRTLSRIPGDLVDFDRTRDHNIRVPKKAASTRVLVVRG